MTKVKKMEVFACISCRDRWCAYAIYVCACESSSSNNSKRDRAYIYDEGEGGRLREGGREQERE